MYPITTFMRDTQDAGSDRAPYGIKAGMEANSMPNRQSLGKSELSGTSDGQKPNGNQKGIASKGSLPASC